MSQLKICDFSGETFKGFEVLLIAMSAMTTQLLSSGEFCKLRYNTIPVKRYLQTFLSVPVTQKCQILSCDTGRKWGIIVKTETQPQIIALLGESVQCAVFSPVQCLQAQTTQFQDRAAHMCIIIFSILQDVRDDDGC